MNRYTLAELLQQCDPNAENPADLAVWDAAHPVGNEVLDDTPSSQHVIVPLPLKNKRPKRANHLPEPMKR
jgi:hypothetical protein